ncbi:uncharacterized protein LOC110901879 [Helianthus annuus]|uniref:uncharacterized protein LOC110901879 n=1 Tax=Helianthus annuus TaxID=4232 RepID=UPI000B903992|nr:uncharacterized protein LOC110901879 [Helianthus annuus]
MGHRGSFTLPCLIGSMSVSHALADLGASLNLMPYKVFAKLDLGEPSPTRMSIRLADRSIKYPRGFIENMLVKIDKFVFPVDFVILDMDEDSKVPLILGRPFLNTARTIVDVEVGQITFRVNDEHVTFDIIRSMQHPQSHDDMLYYVDIVDTCVSSHFQGTIEEIDTDTHLLCENQDGISQERRKTEQLVLQIGDDGSQSPDQFVEIDREVAGKSKPSVEDPPSLELKELPPHLEYAFLDEECHFPVIISASLAKEEKRQLLEVLTLHKKAMAWKIMDIKGINPSFCTQEILMEDNYKPSAQHQMCLNPNMQDVVKKEVIKLLDAGLIYPISDSVWVSPVQVVPMKGDITVVPNDRNKLILTRTVTGWRVCIDYRKLNDATDECMKAFKQLKQRLIEAPILVAPDWALPFEIMCDASDYAIGVVLGQPREKHFHPIYYANKTLHDAQENYTTTEKELLAVVYAFDKFRSYLVLSKTIVYTDHAAIKYLFSKQDTEPCLIRWILLLQEFDIEIQDKKGALNVAADHLSRLEHGKSENSVEEQ